MARKKFKMTGFARFFIAMLILAPLAYIGASYYNGEDGIENLKNLFKGKISSGSGNEQETKQMDEIPVQTNPADTDAKDQRIQQLVEDNNKLKEELRQKTEELETVKADLRKIREALERN